MKTRVVLMGADSLEKNAERTLLIRSLERIRARARWVLSLSRVFAVLALLIGAAVVLGLSDYLLRLPMWVRTLNGLFGVGMAGFLLWRYVRPAWRFSPRLTDIALRIEGTNPGLRGVLASAADFAASTPSDAPLSQALARKVVADAEKTFGGVGTGGLLNGKMFASRAALLAASLALAASLFALSPGLWSIGATRLFAPWAGAGWPKRTGVIDITSGNVHAQGTALPLRAAVIKSNRAWDQTYVAVRYRLVSGEAKGAERRELLTWQDKDVALGGEVGKGTLFERLIEPVADAVEFRFETEDDLTEWRTIRLVSPPAVVEASAIVTPPEYAREIAALSEGAPASAERTEADLGPGTDERAVLPQTLAGSRIELTIRLNKPLDMPESVLEIFQSDDPEEEQPGAEQAEITTSGDTWRIAWTLNETKRLPIRLRDEHGIESVDEAVYRFEALADRPAAATITEPATDRTVLPTALVSVTAEGRDDIGLAWVALEQAVFTPSGPVNGKSGPGGAVELRGERAEAARAEGAGRTLARIAHELDLSTLGVKAGDEVRLAALAFDIRSARLTGAEATRSSPRTLRIISETQFAEEVQKQLAEVRQAAIRVEEQQRTLREQTSSGRADMSVRRGQGQVTERLSRQGEALERLVARVRENRVEDRGLEELISRARTTVNDAGQASGRASGALEEAKNESTGNPDSPEPGAAPPQGGSENQPAPRNSPAPSPGQTPPGAPSEPSAAQPSPGGTPSSASPAGGAAQSQQSPSSSATPGAAQSGSPPARQSPAPNAGETKPEQTPPEQGEEKPAAPLEPKLAEASEAQQEVEDNLRSLIELLDRGEDNWVARNTVERLLREQKEVQEDTKQSGAETAGKSPEQLTPEQKSVLDKIVEKQSQLAEQASGLAKDLREREEKLREKDPAQASGMAQAARRAEQSQISETMKNAASEASQNQTAKAGRKQQQAAEALEEMLKDLDRVDKARDEVLRRQLASIIETLEGLIRQQEGEITALDARLLQKLGLSGLDAGMIKLNQNTGAALDFVKAAGAEAAPVATLVQRAGEAQGGAITEIRRPLLGEAMARDFEMRSLAHLKQALGKAKELDSAAADRQQKKQLADLKKEYRAVLERQTALSAETEPLAAAQELSRRDRQTARGLGERQGVIGAELAEILKRTQDLRDAKVFEFAHRRMGDLSKQSEESLNDARASAAARAQRSLILSLRNIIEALGDPKPEDQKFAEGAQGGGGGKGGGEQKMIPPVKELRLLRGMQIELAAWTVELSAGAAPPPPGADVQDLGKAQRELMRVGKDLIDRLKDGEQPSFPGAIRPGAEPNEPEAPAPPGGAEGGIKNEP